MELTYFERVPFMKPINSIPFDPAEFYNKNSKWEHKTTYKCPCKDCPVPLNDQGDCLQCSHLCNENCNID